MYQAPIRLVKMKKLLCPPPFQRDRRMYLAFRGAGWKQGRRSAPRDKTYNVLEKNMCEESMGLSEKYIRTHICTHTRTHAHMHAHMEIHFC